MLVRGIGIRDITGIDTFDTVYTDNWDGFYRCVSGMKENTVLLIWRIFYKKSIFENQHFMFPNYI
ncbi:MAG: hypothetical protein FWD66_08730 [Paludibacter sp.]|nr:hypothetical protein [Paludibacter sp.]